MTYRIAFLTDSHLGYAARCRTHPASGLNMRVRDGFLGLRETVTQILDADVDVVLHGGDLFHRSHPDIASIAWARRHLERLATAGIPVIGATGNHDFANDRGKSPATAAVHDPDRGITMVTEPHEVYQPVDGLVVHTVSHLGLVSAERAMPEPVDGAVNVLLSHGAAQVPGHEIFACVDSPGEAVIGYDVLTMPWSVGLLGHYHGMGPLPGFNSDGKAGQIWYGGSMLRRGFSDPAGGRGWLLVTIESNGAGTVEPKYIWQRPQHDLPFIDATGLTGAEVDEAIRENLAKVEVGDAIIRQRVVNCSLPVRRGVDTAALNDIVESALVWQLEFHRPAENDFVEESTADAAVTSLRTAGSADLPTMWASWLPKYAEQVDMPDTVRPVVAEQGASLLKSVSVDTETGTSELSTEVTA